jgi:hypothetical protein
MPDKDKDELFSSIKDLPGGENDNKGKAMVAAVLVGIIAVVLLTMAELKGGIPAVVGVLAAFLTYRGVRSS